MKSIIFNACLFITPFFLTAQTKKPVDSVADTAVIKTAGTITEMPYNRLIKSAGTLISYGNSELENHALDIIVMPDKKLLAVEDRYGIAVVDSKSNTLIDRWDFSKTDTYKDLMSTYSGITCFRSNNTDYIIWSAAGKGKSFVMIAEWNGKNIGNIISIKINAVAPAKLALPNQVAVQVENNIPYLYIVLNGNNQLVKMRFADHQVVWTTNTGVAPFGISIIQNKAYITNWAGPLVTDTSKENAGTPWGAAYTNPATGGTAFGTVSVIDINTGKQVQEILA